MGDLLGGPCVSPFSLGLAMYHSSLPLVVPLVSALPIAIVDPVTRSQDTGSRNRSTAIFPPFSAAWKIPSFGDDRRKTAGFLYGRGESYGWTRQVEGMCPVGDR